MGEYYALLSGEHRELPVGELRGILEAENYKYKVMQVLDQLVIFQCENLEPSDILRRAGMVREVGVKLLEAEEPLDLEGFLEKFRDIDWEDIVGDRSFLVRGKRVKDYFKEYSIPSLERKLGEIILDNSEGRVDVRHPNVVVRFFLTSNKLVVGVGCGVSNSKQFSTRRPRRRPFFHPEALDPKLSRVFVNLARSRVGEVLADPFCGTGSILLEAGIIGVRVVGLDVRRDMVEGCLKNLKWYGVTPLGIVRGDATKPPFREVDSIATDPPYGRASTTLGREVERLIREFTNAWADIVGKGRFLCYATPHTVDFHDTFSTRDYRLIEHYSMRVHKSLYRNIVVLEKV